MADVRKQGGKKAGKTKAKRTPNGKAPGAAAAQPEAGQSQSPPPEKTDAGASAPDDKPKRMTRAGLVKKAYEKVGTKLDDPKQSSKAIDDLVKLMKMEKDLGGEKKDVKEIKVRWEPSEDKSSSEG